MGYTRYSKDTATKGGGANSTFDPIWYAQHHDAYLRSWAPIHTGPRPVLIRFHGGGGNGISFEDVARVNPSSTEILSVAFANSFVDAGWGIINVEYGNGGSPSFDLQQSPTFTAFNLVKLACKAIQFVKDRILDGTDLATFGFQIRPAEIVLWGSSFGAWLATMTQYVAPELLSFRDPELGPWASPDWTYHSDFSVAAVYNSGGVASFPMGDTAKLKTNPTPPPANMAAMPATVMSFFERAHRYKPSGWTQDPGGGPGADPWGFAQVPLKVKKALSPVFHLNQNGVGPPQFVSHPTNNIIGEPAQIYNPVTQPLDQVVEGQLLADDPFQAQVWAHWLTQAGIPNVAYWGPTAIQSTAPVLFAWLQGLGLGL